MTTTYAAAYDQFAGYVLADLGAPNTAANRAVLVAWIGGESGWSGTNPAVKANNPLNIKLSTFQSYGIRVDGSQAIHNVVDGTQPYGVFSSPQAGAAATAAYLQKAAKDHGYGPILAGLKASNPAAALNGIALSDWAGGHYGLKVHNGMVIGGTNALFGDYAYVTGSRPAGALGGSSGLPVGSHPVTSAPGNALGPAYIDGIGYVPTAGVTSLSGGPAGGTVVPGGHVSPAVAILAAAVVLAAVL